MPYFQTLSTVDNFVAWIDEQVCALSANPPSSCPSTSSQSPSMSPSFSSESPSMSPSMPTSMPSASPSDNSAAPSAAPSTEFIQYKFLSVNTFHFDYYLSSLPSAAELSGVTRLTEIYWQRAIAHTNGVSYRDVDVTLTAVLVTLGPEKDSITIDYEVTLSFLRLTKLPTVAEAEAALENADNFDLYVSNYVAIAEPAGSVFNE